MTGPQQHLIYILGFFAIGCSEQTSAEKESATQNNSVQTDNNPTQKSTAKTPIPIRIGWQTTWATQGQLAVILQEESILEELGFAATFVGFAYGGPLNEGALAGQVDVLFTADQPAIALCNRDKSWGIIGRLMYNRVGTFVPPASKISGPKDLKGKTIAIPFGAAAHRETLSAVQSAGLNPKTDINTVNMGIKEISVLARNEQWKDNPKWDTVDAGSAWDPIFADLEASGLVTTIASGTVTSVVVMSDNLQKKHPKAKTQFMNALQQAYQVYKTDTESANQRFINASNLKFSAQALDLAASVEPNLNPDNNIRTTLSKEDLVNIQKAADFMTQANILKTQVDTTSMIRE